LSLQPNGYALISVAGCRECVAFPPQDNSEKEGNSAEISSAATPYAPEVNIRRASLGTRGKGKKHRRGSSGGIQGDLSNTRSPKVARVMLRAKGKQVRKVDPPGAKPDTSNREGTDLEAEPREWSFCPVLC
jgi:hypothetical protein